MNEYIQTSGITPIGTIIHFMGTKTPDGYLFCDGSTYNITDYPEFCEFLIDQFGSVNHFGGDGVDTFAVPDLRGEFLRGSGSSSSTGHTGADVGVHQAATQMRHFSYGSNNFNYDGTAYPAEYYADTYIGGGSRTGYYTSKQSYTRSTNLYFTSRPTNTSVYLCIKVK